MNFPHLEVLTKSATPGDIQVMYMHASVWNKSLGETVTIFALAGYLEALTHILIDIKRAFSGDGETINLSTTEVLFCYAAGNLMKPKKLWYWMSSNDTLLPQFLTEAVVLDVSVSTDRLLGLGSY